MLQSNPDLLIKKPKLHPTATHQQLSNADPSNPPSKEQLQILMAEYFPHVASFPVTISERFKQDQKRTFTGSICLFGDRIDSTEEFYSEAEAMDNIYKLACRILQDFVDLLANPCDSIQEAVVSSILDDLKSFKPADTANLLQAAISLPLTNLKVSDASSSLNDKYISTYTKCLTKYFSRHHIDYQTIYRGENNKVICKIKFGENSFESCPSIDKCEAKEDASKKAWEFLKSKEKSQKKEPTAEAESFVSKEAMEQVLQQSQPDNRIVTISPEAAASEESSKNDRKYIDFCYNYFMAKFKHPPQYSYKNSLSKVICFIQMGEMLFESRPSIKKQNALEDVAKKMFDFISTKETPPATAQNEERSSRPKSVAIAPPPPSTTPPPPPLPPAMLQQPPKASAPSHVSHQFPQSSFVPQINIHQHLLPNSLPPPSSSTPSSLMPQNQQFFSPNYAIFKSQAHPILPNSAANMPMQYNQAIFSWPPNSSNGEISSTFLPNPPLNFYAGYTQQKLYASNFHSTGPNYIYGVPSHSNDLQNHQFVSFLEPDPTFIQNIPTNFNIAPSQSFSFQGQ